MNAENNSRRKFIKNAGIFTIGTLGISRSLFSAGINPLQVFQGKQKSKFIQVPLPYSYDALEPSIDRFTMELHYQRHHAGYVVNLNKAIETIDIPSSFEELIANISKYPDAVRNNAGGHFNHTLFWSMMKPKGEGKPGGALSGAINSSFGSFENFRTAFTKAAMNSFGSGWTWLVSNGGKLEIGATHNQDNPVMDVSPFRGEPVLALDVWEHAYYLKYENRRADYINAWWNIVNWAEAERLYAMTTAEK